MKKILKFLLICIGVALLFRILFAGSIFGAVDPAVQEIVRNYYFVEDGKIEIKDGSWQFLKKGMNSYLCSCNFTAVNHSDRTYNIMPVPYLYDRKGTIVLNPSGSQRPLNPFKAGAVLRPEESHVFRGNFNVSWKTALRATVLKIRGGVAVVNEEQSTSEIEGKTR